MQTFQLGIVLLLIIPNGAVSAKWKISFEYGTELFVNLDHSHLYKYSY